MFASNKNLIKVYILNKQLVWGETQESIFLISSLVPLMSWIHGPHFEKQGTGTGPKGLEPGCNSWDCIPSGPSLLWEGSPRRCLTVCGLCFAFCLSHLLRLPEQRFNFEGVVCSDQKQLQCLLILLSFHFPFIFNPVILYFLVISLMLLRRFF